ncbi:MAG: hypothetical protein COV31_01095 [Candidatus Yanofskybacteria bacterium CG10_big_fil_rev_8_21_14_0_10_46_23]|uniref:ABC transporter domain-containing protein n=1 Tax=Candidatus Yanofskybacteria bacterium CG10_big_fil_rev_8_21_14_0_10_46_23 TaxID=1975098 RepID=A0A2H0R4L1_9BACT|nr:MAG: hypothetical protein COV31_01095 [Candidatus Yanofskybacteria bacterium CG10_big_fil_rev_8_21_14_0_10_46_23]
MLLSWAGQISTRISGVGSIHRQMVEMMASVRKYFQMLAIEPEVREPQNPIRPLRFRGNIEFRNIHFSYRNRSGGDRVELSNLALQDVSFSIKSGERVAFVGESGAGKSTIVLALLRGQDPDQGRILIDNNDLRSLDLKRFRGAIGLVEQSVFLFDNTLRYNLTFGLDGRSVQDEELDRVAKMACIDRFFPKLERGYDTLIGERGIRLSGGERQRVGIARALMKNPDFLIFDEATSNLDPVNEGLIREAIQTASQGRTTIIIAHRFSTIRGVDRVIVFDQGQVAGQGTHEELVQSCEPYQRLVESQL